VHTPKPVNVLIVDDDRATQRVLADALTKNGFVVSVERDGEWALRTFAKKTFDAVILDVLLPAVNGYDVLKQLRSLPRGKSTLVVMISGVYKNPLHQKEAVQKHGAHALIEKPVDLAHLVNILKIELEDRFPQSVVQSPPPPPEEEDEVTGEFMADLTQRQEVKAVEVQAKKVKASGPANTKGDFASKSFAELLAEIYRSRASGALLINRDKIKKIVYFREGTPQMVKSNLLVECLGRILVREKMISEAECEESLKRMKSSKRMQGTVLVEMGALSPHNLQYALEMQAQEKLFDAFRWQHGEYQFNPQVAPPVEPLSLNMTCAQLIFQGIRKSWDEARVKNALVPVEHLFVHLADNPLYALQDAGLEAQEAEFLQLIDGHKTVATLRAMNVLEPLETDRLIIAMRAAQMIVLKETAAIGKTKPAFNPKVAALPPPLPPPLVVPPPLPPKLAASKPAISAPESNAAFQLPWENATSKPELPAPSPQASRNAFEGSNQIRAIAEKNKRPMVVPLPPPVESNRKSSLMPELSAVMSVSSISNREGDLRERLIAKWSTLSKLNYFEILGVERSANREELKRSFFTLAREYHPDKHSNSASAEVRALMQQIYDLISTAHDTLTDKSEREKYEASLASGVAREEHVDVTKILAAEGRFQRGENLMRERRFSEAVRCFKEAIEFYPAEGEFHAWLGWSLFQSDLTRGEDAVRHIEHAISLNSKLDKSYLFLGYVQKALGRPDKSERQFEKAIQCNPDCTEALRELRLINRGKR
jgi:DNA-binding response OmpR family regulator